MYSVNRHFVTHLLQPTHIVVSTTVAPQPRQRAAYLLICSSVNVERLSSKRSATSFDYLLTRCVVVINEQDIVLVQLLEITEEKPDSQALAGLYEAMQGDCDLFASGNSVYGKLRTGVNVATDKNSARSV